MHKSSGSQIVTAIPFGTFPVLQVPAQTLSSQTLTLPQICSTTSHISKRPVSSGTILAPSSDLSHPASSGRGALESPKWEGTVMGMCRVSWAYLPGHPRGCMARYSYWLPLRLGLGAFLYVVKEGEIREQINSVPHKMNAFFPIDQFSEFLNEAGNYGEVVLF